MTARHDRLTRLLAVRSVRLAIVARALTAATAAAASAAATANRLGALRDEFLGNVGSSGGYTLKATVATRDALAAAEVNQHVRRVEAEARRSAIDSNLRNHRAGVDAVARAVDRSTAATVAADRP